MKKLVLAFLTTIIFLLLSSSAIAASAKVEKDFVPVTKAKSAYLVDESTGTVLYERNADEPLPIASMVKIMTLLLAFEEIEAGQMTLTQTIVVSPTAAGMGGSQMFLDAGSEYTVSDLIKGIVVCSANDASVAIGETISGSKEAFIDRMNERAKELGMTNTVFVNVTGLPEKGQHSTARDVSKMMGLLLKFPKYYDYSTIYMENFTHPSGRVTELVNTNKMIRFYEGCDAGKTGFTNDAMFCLSSSAKRNNLRVVATVIGAPDSKSRFAEIRGLFDYAFANYKQNRVVNAEELIENNVEVVRGKTAIVQLKADKNIDFLVKKGESAQYSYDLELPSKLKAPLHAGEVVGKIRVLKQDGTLYDEANLLLASDVEALGYLDALEQILTKWFLHKKVTTFEQQGA